MYIQLRARTVGGGVLGGGGGGAGRLADLHEALTDGTRRDTDFAVMIASCVVRVKLLEESY